jgi:hypothetical protein
VGFSISSSGSFAKMEAFLNKMSRLDITGILNAAGRQGVSALAGATPIESGLASSSWSYTVARSGGGVSITWTNNDIEDGFPVAIRLQYGYGTGTGGYVAGRDYINPAMRPVFDEIADRVWKAVTSA